MSCKTLFLTDKDGNTQIKACYIREETSDGFLLSSNSTTLRFNVYIKTNLPKHHTWQSVIYQRLEYLYPSYHHNADKLVIVQKTNVFLIPREKFIGNSASMTMAEANQYRYWNLLVESDFLSNIKI